MKELAVSEEVYKTLKYRAKQRKISIESYVSLLVQSSAREGN